MRSQANPPQAEGNDAALGVTMAAEVRRLMLDALVRIGADEEPADRAALTVKAAKRPIAPARLANDHPPGAARTQARELYERCLAHYRTVVRVQDLASGVDDVGAAVAAFVAANLSALHGAPVTPEILLRLERQLSGVVRVGSAWDGAPARERQAYFEQMALLAVLVSECAKQAPLQGPAAVANVQLAARGYLQQLIGLNPDHLTLGPTGLVPRAPMAN
jgi:hypothetical protein